AVGGVGLASVGAGYRTHDCQPEPAAAVAPARRGAAEALERALDEGVRKALAAVGDVDLDAALDLANLERDRTRAVAERVVDHAPDRLVEAQAVGDDHRVRL